MNMNSGRVNSGKVFWKAPLLIDTIYCYFTLWIFHLIDETIFDGHVLLQEVCFFCALHYLVPQNDLFQHAQAISARGDSKSHKLRVAYSSRYR